MQNLISIDLGFSFCKAIINGERYIIKSVIGDSKKLRFEDINMQRSEHDYIVSNMRGHEYFVSDLAVHQSKVQLHSLKANRFDETATKVLVNTLFGMGLGSGSFEGKVVSGLPVSHYANHKEDIKKLFLGTQSKKHEYHVQINGEDIKGSVFIDDGKFIPQPFGSLVDVMLDNDGDWERKDLARKLVAVIDIGFGTSDIYVCDKLEPLDDLSFSTTTAMNTAYSLIAKNVAEYGGKDYLSQLHKLEDFVRSGTINVNGQTLKLKPIIDFAFEQTALQLVSEIHNMWHSESTRIDQIFISGGGGIALSKCLIDEFRDTELIPESQWSVVRGYEKWGKRTWKDLGGDLVGTTVHVSSDTQD